MAQKVRNNERGNALWFILIAVVLLGLLTMILSKGGSSTDQTGDFEQTRIQATQIMRTAKSLQAAVQDMKLRGVSENDISFENTVSTTDYTNANCDDASDASYPGCLVFNVEGAGQNYTAPKAAWLASVSPTPTYYGDWLFTGDTCIPDVGGVTGTGTCATAGEVELMAILPYITKELCEHINTTLRAKTSTANPPVDAGSAWVAGSAEFTGTYGANATNLTDAGNADIVSQEAGCFEGGGGTPDSGTYHFYQVLLAR